MKLQLLSLGWIRPYTVCPFQRTGLLAAKLQHHLLSMASPLLGLEQRRKGPSDFLGQRLPCFLLDTCKN